MKTAIVHLKSPSKSPWKVQRLVDERTEDTALGFDFPTRLGGKGFAVIDDDLSENSEKIRKHLKKRGAAFDGDRKTQISFVRKLVASVASKPLILAMKPGFRGPHGFLQGNRPLGTAKGSYRARKETRGLGQPSIGDRRGTYEGWVTGVGQIALHSSYLSFGVLVGLAAPGKKYLEIHRNETTQLPLPSESLVINFAGSSGSGKTSVGRAVAGLIGPPDLVAQWDFTRRGLEELAESRNDHPLILDDTETNVDNDNNFKMALRSVNEILPKGSSKTMSKKAADVDLPPMTWTTIGFTTSPEPIEEIARRLHWQRTDGERVRWPDIPIPGIDEGGIFDKLKGSPQQRVEAAKKLIAKLEAAIAQHYGIVYSRWMHFLLAEDRSKHLLERTEFFVNRMVPHGNGWDARFARKFGLFYAVGRLATEAGILPWPLHWPYKAVARCYRRALRAIRTDESLTTKALSTIVNNAAEATAFIAVTPKSQRPIRFTDRTLGLRTRYRGCKVLAIRDDRLGQLAGSRAAAKAVVKKLENGGALLGGHGHASTTQLPVGIRIKGRNIHKPRFWVIDRQRLLEMMTGTDSS